MGYNLSFHLKHAEMGITMKDTVTCESAFISSQKVTAHPHTDARMNTAYKV